LLYKQLKQDSSYQETDKALSSDKETREATYGGCRSRLDYDFYQKETKIIKKKDDSAVSDKKRSISPIVIFVSLVVFVLVGILILDYHNNTLRSKFLSFRNPEISSSVEDTSE